MQQILSTDEFKKREQTSLRSLSVSVDTTRKINITACRENYNIGTGAGLGYVFFHSIPFHSNYTIKLIILYINTSTSLLYILGLIFKSLNIHLLVHSIDKSHAYTLLQSRKEKRNRTGAADDLQ